MEAGVAISPNVKRTKIRIDINGNEIDPETKQVIKAADKDYIPAKKDIEAASSKLPPTPEEVALAKKEIKAGKIVVPNKPAGGIESKIETMISSKIEAIIEKKINDVLEKLLQ